MNEYRSFQVVDYFRTASMEEARAALDMATLILRGRERTRRKPVKAKAVKPAAPAMNELRSFRVVDYFRTAAMEEARATLDIATLILRGRERTRRTPTKAKPAKVKEAAHAPRTPDGSA